MLYEKLIVISTNCLDKRIVTLFGLNEIISSGISVEYWNITNLTYHESLQQETVEGVVLQDFNTINGFRTAVRGCISKPYLFLVYANYGAKTFFCYRELSKINANIAYCVNGVFPAYRSSERLKGLMKANIKNFLINRYYGILKKTCLLKPLNYQFNTCKNAVPSYKIDNNTKIIPFNSTDFISTRVKEERLIENPYIVYIDQFLPLHPDRKLTVKKDLDPIKFYSSLNSLFDRIEQKTGKQVVIAAHPVATSYKTNNPFHGRKLYFSKTKQLVEHCDGIMTHHSTAFTMAIVYKKPIIFITSDEIQLNACNVHKMACKLTTLIDGQLVNMDHTESFGLFKEVNPALYDNYKYGYMTNFESEYKKNSDILISVLRGDYE